MGTEALTTLYLLENSSNNLDDENIEGIVHLWFEINADAYQDKEIFSFSDDKDIKTFERALKRFDKNKIKEMIKNGFDINQCDSKGNTLLRIFEDWCYDNFDYLLDRNNFYLSRNSRKRVEFLQSVGAEIETEKSIAIKKECRKRELNNSKLAKIRNKAAKTKPVKLLGKVISKDIEKTEIKPWAKAIEKKISDAVLGKIKE